MDGNSHFLFGAAVSTSLALNLTAISEAIPKIPDTPEMVGLLVMGGLLGSIFPDIDNPESHAGKLSAPVSNGIAAISGRTGSRHRGILHSLVFNAVLFMTAYIWCMPLIGFAVGCLSHIFLDAFNPSGIPLLLHGKLRVCKIPSGSKASTIVAWVLSVAVITTGAIINGV